ncbi:MAG TPA: hypothetical protein VFJ51_01045 [Nitrososphaeraceae archaeon]|nr:hypothetical protein [Nitrososphaeraceae archaeon]
MQSSRVTFGKLTLNFRIKGKKGTAIFHYKCDLEDDAIEYIDIEYTDPEIQFSIEENTKIMERVDIYIRNLLLKRNRFNNRHKTIFY